MMRKLRVAFRTTLYLFLLITGVVMTKAVRAQDTTDAITQKADEQPNYRTNDLACVNSDVYIVGSYMDKKLAMYDIACYWKNDVHFPLTSKDGSVRPSDAKAVAVSNKNDVYIIGQFSDASSNLFTCWKNGKWEKEFEMSIPDISVENYAIEIIDMAVDNNSLYVLFSNRYAYYIWQDGKVKKLRAIKNEQEAEDANSDVTAAPPYNTYVTAKTIKVYNGDVYVAGSANIIGSNYSKPVYWKNGQHVALALPGVKNDYTEGKATDLVVNDKGVWVCGYYKRKVNHEIACYWENGQLKEVSPWYASASAQTILLQGNDVYVAGYLNDYEPSDNKMACYWKNGQLVPLFVTDSVEIEPTVIALIPSATTQPVGFVATYHADNIIERATYTVEKGTLKPLELQLPDEAQFAAAFVNDITLIEGDVYALGSSKQAGSKVEVPVYWKNGSKQVLSMPPNSIKANAYHIAVEKDNWMVLGWYIDSTDANAVSQYCYWKNGVFGKFEDQFKATDAKIVNGNIYITGFKLGFNELTSKWKYQGLYYINDKEYKLSIPNTAGYYSSYPFTIEVTDGKVYITGDVANYDNSGKSTKQHAALWVNGVCTVIPAANAKHYYTGTQVITRQGKTEVIGTYVYSKFNSKVNKYTYTTGSFSWQPGAPMKVIAIKAPMVDVLKNALGEHYTPGSYCDICYSAELTIKDKNQIHTLLHVGESNDKVYVIDGHVQRLPLASGMYGKRNNLYALAVRDGKAYVGGSYFDENGNEKACYWLDGKRVDLE